MAKNADDATLLAAQKIDVQIQDEFNSVTNWASVNKLTINVSKTLELVFHRPNPWNYLSPAEIKLMERVSDVNLLGVWSQKDVRFTKHVDYITHISNKRL